jgi:hypothetical protein
MPTIIIITHFMVVVEHRSKQALSFWQKRISRFVSSSVVEGVNGCRADRQIRKVEY